MDFRIFDALTGRLIKVFNNLVDEKSAGDLTSFVIGSRERKVIVGDDVGLCRIYNVNSGELIEKIVKPKHLKDRAENELKDRKKDFKKKTYEIEKVLYLDDEKLIVTASDDSIIRIYESEDGKEVEPLRELRGGHKESEITSITYNKQTLTLVSGASNGTVCLWGFQSSKLDACYSDDEIEVVNAEIVYPWKLLVSVNSLGVISGFKMDTIKSEQIHLFRIDLKGSIDANVIFSLKDSMYYPLPLLKSKANDVMKRGVHLKIRTEEDFKTFQKAYPRDPKKKQKDLTFKDLELIRNSSFGLENHSIKSTFYFGDSRGRIRVIIFDELAKRFNCEQYPNNLDIKELLSRHLSFLKRKENIVAEKASENYLHEEKKSKQRFEPFNIPGDLIVFAEWEAHHEDIVSINKVEKVSGLITCGVDKFVRIWSAYGEMWCQIHLIEFDKRIWNFPYDWVTVKMSEIEKNIRLMQRIELKEYSKSKVEQLKSDHLYRNFILPHLERRKEMIKRSKKIPENREDRKIKDYADYVKM